MKTLQQLGTDLGALVEQKNAAYGDSFRVAGEALRLLYPDGIPPAQLDDALLLARIWDKMKRIATDKDAFGETPYQDIAGYGLLGVDLHQHKKETSPTWPGSASDQAARNSSKAPSAASAEPSTNERTTTSASGKIDKGLSRLHAHYYERNWVAPAPIATEAVKKREADRAAKRNELLHTYEHWVARSDVDHCVACDQRQTPHLMLGSFKAITNDGIKRFFTCSESCWKFCRRQLNLNKVIGAMPGI